LVAIAPARWEYQQGLGTAQYNLGRFEDALGPFEKALPLARRSAEPADDNSAKAKAAVAQMLTMEGNVYLKLKKNPEAIDAFTKAAALSSNPGVAYFNLCAVSYNTGNTEAALAACDKAIGADPTKADAYFIKGSVMLGNGAVATLTNMTAFQRLTATLVVPITTAIQTFLPIVVEPLFLEERWSSAAFDGGPLVAGLLLACAGSIAVASSAAVSGIFARAA